RCMHGTAARRYGSLTSPSHAGIIRRLVPHPPLLLTPFVGISARPDPHTSAADSAAASGDNSTRQRPAAALDALGRRRAGKKIRLYSTTSTHLGNPVVQRCTRGPY